MTTASTFWDKAATKYAASKMSDPEGYRATLERTRAHLQPQDHVLEIGCGTASTAIELAPSVAHFTATDISSAMIDIGREKTRAAGVENISLFVREASDVPEGPFDAILAFNLLHLLPNQAETLARVHASLKPDGLFISKTICLAEKWYFRPLIGVMALFGKAPFVTHQRVDELRAAILAAGFEPVEELIQSGAAPRLYLVARRV
ncbi:class I SAM-dependent methyltransferase [Gymnodinialimonas ceratoperidinii]|uniref:Class I SAM-dependent methyltransferase n=1 Tax=Gymnodinialimonas ceratoperidinii TaxID=2856823 RepID=A0A8F6TSY9_9RHOB|nr:class I SAM-dependent methyltransferase [Gymnodinialimonas ceratoperidinii]QXT38115.1 class I SAM-dependent methyltransferase [Gymnodinialimonas ceratoperidinii]